MQNESKGNDKGKGRFPYREYLRGVFRMMNQSEYSNETALKGITVAELRGISHQLARIADALESIDSKTHQPPPEAN